jgi:hypothetical protein
MRKIMAIIIYAALAIFVTLATCMTVYLLLRPQRTQTQERKTLEWCTSECSLCAMHRPRSGCPMGWEEKPDVFTLNDEDVPGCIKTQPAPQSVEPGFEGVNTCLDMLRPHEGITFNLAPFPPPAPPKPKKQQARRI